MTFSSLSLTINRAQQLSSLLRFATCSPVLFTQATREGIKLILDRELSHNSPLPTLPSGILDSLCTLQVKLPPRVHLVNGTQSPEGLRFLVALSKGLGARRAFEIGTFTGVTAYTLAVNLSQLLIDTLDLPLEHPPAFAIEHADRNFIPSPSRQRIFQGRVEGARITQHEADSANFNFQTFGHAFDLVYVDGAHSYDYVANDSRAALDIVADDGAIVWDDYQWSWPGVVRYLNERTDLPIYRIPGTHLVLWLSEKANAKLTSFRSIGP